MVRTSFSTDTSISSGLTPGIEALIVKLSPCCTTSKGIAQFSTFPASPPPVPKLRHSRSIFSCICRSSWKGSQRRRTILLPPKDLELSVGMGLLSPTYNKNIGIWVMFVNKHCRDHLDSLIYFVSICKPEAIQACLTSSESPHYRTEVPGHP